MKTEKWVRRRLDECDLGTLGHAYPDGPLIMVVSKEEWATAIEVSANTWLGGKAQPARIGMGIWFRVENVWQHIPTTPIKQDLVSMMDQVRSAEWRMWSYLEQQFVCLKDLADGQEFQLQGDPTLTWERGYEEASGLVCCSCTATGAHVRWSPLMRVIPS